MTRVHKFTVAWFFLCFLVLGLLIYKDYGISWDEPIQYKYGQDNFNFVVYKNPSLLKSHEKYYGPVVEFSFVLIQNVLKLSSLRDIYFLRHLLTFFIFYV